MLKRGHIIVLVVFLGGVIGSVLYVAYQTTFGSSVNRSKEENLEIFIHPEDTYEELLAFLQDKIRNPELFNRLAKHKELHRKMKAGHYTIPRGTSNNELINRLLSGNQQPVKVNFNSLRTLSYLSKTLSMQLEPDSIEFITFFQDSTALQRIGIHIDSLYRYLLPDTYEFYWTATPEDFMVRMKKESEQYWLSKKNQAAQKNLTPWEVVTLAAIVERETLKDDEKPTIAGVYLNRLKKNMKLQADPTVVYAVGDFSLRRILKVHTRTDHPYNTYKHKGLPPGPICVPSKTSIEAVLRAKDHPYLYFCAKEDMSGYHNFAKTYRQHKKNARKFQRELNKKGIK
ncbi:MAG: aminodeoxychorismate lyase [Bacteroidetes bacterium]|nr:MAG: aminodeoxychorismate lyase [Bacteroidota bacterium]